MNCMSIEVSNRHIFIEGNFKCASRLVLASLDVVDLSQKDVLTLLVY